MKTKIIAAPNYTNALMFAERYILTNLMIRAAYLMYKDSQSNKVQLIKFIREVAGVCNTPGLKESKEVADFLIDTWSSRPEVTYEATSEATAIAQIMPVT